jgi:hypothetical protein
MNKMKKVIFFAICIVVSICFSSCRSTSKSCGLAAAISIDQKIIEQPLL